MSQRVGLQFLRARSQEALLELTSMYPVRIQPLGAPQWDGKNWTLWFWIEERNRNVKAQTQTKTVVRQ